MPVANGAQQHGQIDTHQQACGRAFHQAVRHIAGRCTKHIGQHQRACRAAVCQQGLRGSQRGFGAFMGRNVQHTDVIATVCKNVQRAFAQRMRQGRVGNQQDVVGSRGHGLSFP